MALSLWRTLYSHRREAGRTFFMNFSLALRVEALRTAGSLKFRANLWQRSPGEITDHEDPLKQGPL